MLIETVKIQNGIIHNLHLHNERIKKSRREILGINSQEDISFLPEILTIPVTERIIKARILYDKRILKVEWEYYKPRIIKSLKIVEDNEIEYSYKFSDRSTLDKLYAKRGECDEIIIVKNGFLTDSTFSNLVFHDGRRWVTPSTPLLPGTKRNQLIKEGKIEVEELMVSDLKRFNKCSLINALNDLGEIIAVWSMDDIKD